MSIHTGADGRGTFAVQDPWLWYTPMARTFLTIQGDGESGLGGRGAAAAPSVIGAPGSRAGACSLTVVVVRGVPWWGLVSSAVAPVLLAGGWTVAAGLQPRSFNAVADTISSLAAEGATDRWVMTAALAGVGTCHLVTGLALRPAAPAGRLILMTGGAATVLVAANPEPAGGSSLPHTVWAAVGFIALTAWPLAARKRGPLVPAALRPAVSAAATGVLFGLLVWFGTELIGGGRQVGLAERALAGAQALWPLAVVLACRRSQPRARFRRTGRASADLQN
jgi:Protein of unknown function (DUF998)